MRISTLAINYKATYRNPNRLAAVDIQESNFSNKSWGMIEIESDRTTAPSIVWILVIVLLNNKRLALGNAIPRLWIGANQRVATVSNAWA
jgi:hypothetical protein